MPALFPLLRLPAAVALLMLGAGAAFGSDHAAAPKAAASAAEPATPATPAAPTKAGPRVVQDPMDMLRERLAAKLGASKAPSTDNVVRVVSKASTSAVDEHAPAIAPRPARHKPAAATAEAPREVHPAHWDYAGSGGPETWGQMKPEFAKCSSGTRQSPIDIRDGIKVNLDAVQFDYKASGFRVIDNGHTVQVNLAPGNSIEVMGRRYDLVQFHFHRPSEERIDGRQFDMVVHLVHKDIDGRLAVVAVLLDRGSAQPIVQSVWNNLPLEKGDEIAARGVINLNELLPAERSYFTYMGSLTTPPCSEGVLWMVMKQPVPISADQIGIFARLYPMNARPIQSAAGRLIKESN
jgi:carbonic anhydrase